MTIARLALGCAATLALAAPADAVILQYDISGPLSASFTLDSERVPDDFDSESPPLGDTDFSFLNVAGSFGDLTVADIVFYSETFSGGIQVADANNNFVILTSGPVLFSGTTANPTLLTGTFELFGERGVSPGTFTLTVSEVAAAVPEPATWAMMIAGFGLVGGTMRRRHSQALTA